MNPARFQHFIAIDWSGAAGERHKGIALAIARADGGPPMLISPGPVSSGRGWSRTDVLELLRNDLPTNSCVGMDLGISLPFADFGAFFPGWSQSPENARGLWALVDEMCAIDVHLGVSRFVSHEHASRYFRRHGGLEGELFGGGRGRFRVTEMAQAERLGCRPYSNFNLVGAAQVGKSSLTGMRLLNRLAGALPVWPIDPLPSVGSVLVEIYTTIAAMAAGRTAGRSKIRTIEELNAGLATLGSPPVLGSGALDDHSADALITAAWLRNHAKRPELWTPDGLTTQIAQTEGWTFGVP